MCIYGRQEMSRDGVKVSIVEPGTFKTNILSDTNLRGILQNTWDRMSLTEKADYGDEYVDRSKYFNLYKHCKR